MLPVGIKDSIKDQLWEIADEIGWLNLGLADKSRYYEVWTSDPDIGGRLGMFMELGQVRVYIKDTLMKDYGRIRLADEKRPLRALGLSDATILEEYIKPHGRRMNDGRVISWGRADDWKSILMAVHERAYWASSATPFGAVFLLSTGRYHEARARSVVEDAAAKLGVQKVVWLD